MDKVTVKKAILHLSKINELEIHSLSPGIIFNILELLSFPE